MERDFRSVIGAVICLVVLLTLPAGAWSGQSSDAEYFGRTIRSIQFQVEAGQPLNQERFAACIPSKAGAPLTRTGLKASIQALYETGSFSEIVVFAAPAGDGVELQFQLRRSSYFNRFVISGGVNLHGQLPSEVIALPVGARFTVEVLEGAKRAVVAYLQERGYYQARVQANTVPVGDGTLIDTTFDVQLGPQATIRSLTIDGVPENERLVMRERLGLRPSDQFDGDRVTRKLAGLKKYLLDRGFLEANPQIIPTYEPADNSVALQLSLGSFGQVRVAVDGFSIPKERLSRLLPVLSGEGQFPVMLEEGKANLKEYLEENGYPEASITLLESREPSGLRLLRYQVERGRRVTVKEIQFRGNRAFTSAELLKSIQIQPARFLQKSVYSISKLDADVEALQSSYRAAGYLDATVVPLVETANKDEKLRITFECSEGGLAKTRSVTIPAGLSLPAAVVESRMRLKAGSPYSPSLAERDRQGILAIYYDRGFLQPVVTYSAEGPDANLTFAVKFEIVEGTQSRIDRIVVLGKDATRDSVIQKRIKMKPDDPLSLGRMLETQQALYGTGVFDLVRVAPQNPESGAALQNVIVRLREARPLILRYGIGYQEREKVRGILELTHLNIFGLGRRVDLRLRGSAIEQAGSLSFQQPQIRFLPVDSYFILSGGKKQEVSFDVRRWDLSYQYSHPFNTHTWGLLRYNFTNVRVSNVPPDLAREETPRNLSTVSAFYVNDTRDDYLDPQRGFMTSTDLSLTTKLPAPLLPSGLYASIFSQSSYYRRLAGPFLMVAAFRFGFKLPLAGDRSIPLSERFFAGGSSSLRGFETDRAGPLDANNQPIGGNALLIGNFEVRLPLISRLALAGFYDSGNVFTRAADIRIPDFSHTLGIGLRLKTPLGPIRIDYGFNMNLSEHLKSIGYKTGHFFLTIGPLF